MYTTETEQNTRSLIKNKSLKLKMILISKIMLMICFQMRPIENYVY